MHLREIEKTEELMDVMCRIIDPVSKISGDPEMEKLLTECLEKAAEAETGIQRILCYVPLQKAVLSRHKSEAIEIIAVTTGRTKEEVEDQSPVRLMSDVRNMLTGDFTAFFT